jgi:predicted RNase H-like HicB family nuclease
MNYKYGFIIYWSRQDNAFTAEVLESPGCMTDGNTYQDAVKNAETIIEDWMETIKNLGRQIPEPKGNLIYA